MDKNLVFAAIDADNAGRKVGQSVLADDVQGLHEISERIVHGQDLVKDWVESRGGQKISGGGDEMTILLPEEAVEELEHLRKDYQFAIGLTISIGVGKSLSEAGRALLVAKFRGKDQVAMFDQSVAQEIESAKQRVADGTASPEEFKLADAYLSPKEEAEVKPEQSKNQVSDEHDDCPYCQELKAAEDSDPDHCQYCHDMDNEHDEEACPYCQEMDAESEEAPEGDEEEDREGGEEVDAEAQPEEGSEEVTPTAGPTVSEPTAQTSGDFDQVDMNAPDLPKPEVGDRPPMEVESKPEERSVNNVRLENPPDTDTETQTQDGALEPNQGEGIQNDDETSTEAMADLAAQLEDGDQASDREVAQDTDDADIPAGDMVDNVSRPAQYDEGNPNDMGLAEDEVPTEQPDLSAVLQEGLDSHSDNIQREKVVQMVAEALEGFKQSKAILEKAKQQAPQLYASSIAMLRAMIEMAQMLGLGDAEEGAPQGEEEPEEVPEEGAPEDQQEDDQEPSEADGRPQADWQEPFPQHPDHGQAQPQQAAGIGQSAGKLSSKHTSKHVVRTPMPPGAINAKGQQKVIDPKTGKVRWIDRKAGMVQSPTGVPIKPPKEGTDAQRKV